MRWDGGGFVRRFVIFSSSAVSEFGTSLKYPFNDVVVGTPPFLTSGGISSI
jgi:hypothetical protein